MTKVSNYVPPGAAGIVYPSTPGSSSVISSGVLTTEGDLLYEHSGAPTRLPIGSNAYLLTSNGTDPYWAVNSALVDPTTTEGDIIYRHTGALARLPIGSNAYVLTSNGTDPTWAVASGGMTNPMTAVGDLIVGGTVTGGVAAPTNLAAGTSAYVLTANGAGVAPSWQASASGFADPTTTKGDLIVHGTSTTRLGVGSNTYVLTADSTQTLGVKWAPGGSGSGNVSAYAAVEIDGLSGSPDAKPGSPSAADDEFNAFSGWTQLGSPDVANVTDVASNVHIQKAACTGVAAIYKACPTIPFTVTAKVTEAIFGSNYCSDLLIVAEASPGKLLTCGPIYTSSGGTPDLASEVWSSFTTRTSFTDHNYGAGWVLGITPAHYLRLIVHSSTNIDFYFSLNGDQWWAVQTGMNPGFTVGSVGLAVSGTTGSVTAGAYFDWVRFT